MSGQTESWQRLRAAIGEIAIPGLDGDEIATNIENTLRRLRARR